VGVGEAGAGLPLAGGAAAAPDPLDELTWRVRGAELAGTAPPDSGRPFSST
jgi:hypothetical protein